MPFYIFKISPSDGPEYIDMEEKYRPAREKIRTLRKEDPADSDSSYRMIYANTVAQGETLYRISKQFGVSVEQLRTMNNIGPDNTIFIGQSLRISP